MEFRFAVLEHRLIPQGAHLKQWQIAEVDGRLWLNLTLAIQRTVAEALSDDDAAAGLDIGWRRTEEGIRIGVLYEPLSGATKEVLLDFQRSPRDHSQRTAFRLDLGPTRWERRNITSLIPGWKAGDPIPGTVELRDVLSKRRSTLKDTAKAQFKAHLGDRTPPWFSKAGKRGLIKLAGELAEDGVVREIVTRFVAQTDALDGLASQYFEQSTRRVKYGYQQIAHDLLKYVQGRGIRRIVVEKGFLSQLAKQEPDRGADGYYALQNSQKYRQFAGVGTLVAILKTIARKYGIRVEEREAANTTRYCYWCGHLNPATAKRQFECAGCGREFDQDVNAAANLSHFPSVAMAASNAG